LHLSASSSSGLSFSIFRYITLLINLSSIIIYFMSGLARSAGAFFTFYLFVYTTYLTMTSFFRLIGTTMRSYDVAARLAAIIISLMVLYTGQ
jgi:ATP-binding cassette subfamily G (WHITE) protein 2 (SNQ2)